MRINTHIAMRRTVLNRPHRPFPNSVFRSSYPPKPGRDPLIWSFAIFSGTCLPPMRIQESGVHARLCEQTKP